MAAATYETWAGDSTRVHADQAEIRVAGVRLAKTLPLKEEGGRCSRRW